MELKNKKVLLVGLGILGGGLSMAKYILSKGASLTITDLRDEKALAPTIKKLPADIAYTIGEHKKSDFESADIIIFNPAVPFTSEWVNYAKKLGKPYFNDYTFFMKTIRQTHPNALIIGVTGTRGKTTVASWINHLIPSSTLGGNILSKNLFAIIDKKTDLFVLELSSFQLEFAHAKTDSPDLAIITNIYIDHLNRYKTVDRYQEAKFHIFENQDKNDALILNLDEEITKKVLAEKPKAHLFYISLKPIPKDKNGMFFEDDYIYYQYEGIQSRVTKAPGMADHERKNLLAAMLAAHLMGMPGEGINQRILDLPTPLFRQELVFENKKYKIINDSAGTSPEATMAAIEKFKADKNFVLICGGTNKELDFSGLAKKVLSDVNPEDLFLLEGSGTDLLLAELVKIGYPEMVPYENLEDIVDVVSQESTSATIVFSPSCASFEKFKNEFDRGQKFNKLVKKYFG